MALGPGVLVAVSAPAGPAAVTARVSAALSGSAVLPAVVVSAGQDAEAPVSPADHGGGDRGDGEGQEQRGKEQQNPQGGRQDARVPDQRQREQDAAGPQVLHLFGDQRPRGP
ncbi:hypothetical protein, partial [Nonomuraea sp. NPDC003201]